MAHKQTEEVITDYFSELLGDSGSSESSKPSTDDDTSSIKPIEETKTPSADAPIDAATETTAENKVANATANSSVAKEEASRKEHLKGYSTEGNAIGLNPIGLNSTEKDTEKVHVTSNLVKADVAIETKTVKIGSVPQERIDSSLSKTNELSVSKPKVSPALAEGKSESVETDSYEQHKQRLKKMLMQVSAIDASPVKTVAEGLPAIKQPEPNTPIEVEDVSLELAQTDFQPLPTLSSEWLENGRPNWAQERFDILLIEVNGLQLAVPLVALGQIQPMDEDLTPLFGQSDWFMGLQKSPAGNVKTVNTAKFVMPERYQDDHDYKFVVSINGLNWGLAVDRIHQPISVDPDSIRWRVNRSSRPWMAGMVKDHMCVLLDIPSMGELLQKQDKNHR